MTRLLLLAAALAPLLFGAAWAQTADSARLQEPRGALAEIRTCLDGTQQTDDDGRGCVGAAMELCSNLDGGETTLGMVRCATAAREAWDILLNDYYLGARQRLDPPAAEALRLAQRAWITYRDRACAVWEEVYRGGTLARVAVADCLRDLTARRALDLKGFADLP